MLRIVFIILVLPLLYLSAYGQDVNAEIASAFEQEQYQFLLDFENKEALNASSYFTLGFVNYKSSQDAKALAYFDLAVHEDPAIADYHFYQAMCNLYLRNFNKAEAGILKAINLHDNNPLYQIAQGDIYYNQNKLLLALPCYEQAIKIEGCPDRAYVMKSQLLADLGYLNQAIKAYEYALGKVDPFDEGYTDCLFNLGMIYIENYDYERAISILSQLVELRPLDYEVMAKMVQSYYALNDFENAEKWKQKIYQGYKSGLLPKQMNEMFCFDQFIFEGHKIMAFESFNEPDNNLYYKHIFYVVSPDGKIQFSIQTEHSTLISSLNKHYVLGKTQNGGHSSYFEHLFEKDFDYIQLKKAVMDVFGRK